MQSVWAFTNSDSTLKKSRWSTGVFELEQPLMKTVNTSKDDNGRSRPEPNTLNLFTFNCSFRCRPLKEFLDLLGRVVTWFRGVPRNRAVWVKQPSTHLVIQDYMVKITIVGIKVSSPAWNTVLHSAVSARLECGRVPACVLIVIPFSRIAAIAWICLGGRSCQRRCP